MDALLRASLASYKKAGLTARCTNGYGTHGYVRQTNMKTYMTQLVHGHYFICILIVKDCNTTPAREARDIVDPTICLDCVKKPRHRMSNTKTAAKEATGKASVPHDTVCNSYLESYSNFTKESSSRAAAAESTIAKSKKGAINRTLAALNKASPAKGDSKYARGMNQTQTRGRSTGGTSTLRRAESPVRRGLGDMGIAPGGRK